MDDFGATIVENAGEGIDAVWVNSYRINNYVLGANLEKLYFLVDLTPAPPAGVTGYGNALDNTVGGSAGSDVLLGLSGNDSINTNGGNDTVDGGVGNDVITTIRTT